MKAHGSKKGKEKRRREDDIPPELVTHQRGVSCDVQVLGAKSYQDFSPGLHKY